MKATDEEIECLFRWIKEKGFYNKFVIKINDVMPELQKSTYEYENFIKSIKNLDVKDYREIVVRNIFNRTYTFHHWNDDYEFWKTTCDEWIKYYDDKFLKKK